MGIELDHATQLLDVCAVLLHRRDRWNLFRRGTERRHGLCCVPRHLVGRHLLGESSPRRDTSLSRVHHLTNIRAPHRLGPFCARDGIHPRGRDSKLGVASIASEHAHKSHASDYSALARVAVVVAILETGSVPRVEPPTKLCRPVRARVAFVTAVLSHDRAEPFTRLVDCRGTATTRTTRVGKVLGRYRDRPRLDSEKSDRRRHR